MNDPDAHADAADRDRHLGHVSIIYDLLNDMKDVMGGALEPEEREKLNIRIDPEIEVRDLSERVHSRIGPAGAYMRSIIAWPKPEHDTFFAPSICRAKS